MASIGRRLFLEFSAVVAATWAQEGRPKDWPTVGTLTDLFSALKGPALQAASHAAFEKRLDDAAKALMGSVKGLGELYSGVNSIVVSGTVRDDFDRFNKEYLSPRIPQEQVRLGLAPRADAGSITYRVGSRFFSTVFLPRAVLEDPRSAAEATLLELLDEQLRTTERMLGDFTGVRTRRVLLEVQIQDLTALRNHWQRQGRPADQVRPLSERIVDLHRRAIAQLRIALGGPSVDRADLARQILEHEKVLKGELPTAPEKKR